MTVNVPQLKIPPPYCALPFRMVNLERRTSAAELEIANTEPAWLPSTIVVVAPEPIILRLILMVRFSV